MFLHCVVLMWCVVYELWIALHERYERQETNVEHTVNEVSYEWDHLSHYVIHSVSVAWEGMPWWN